MPEPGPGWGFIRVRLWSLGAHACSIGSGDYPADTWRSLRAGTELWCGDLYEASPGKQNFPGLSPKISLTHTQGI